MKRGRRSAIGTLLTAAGLLVAACTTTTGTPGTASADHSTASATRIQATPTRAVGVGPRGPVTEAVVTAIVDGDTIHVAIDGEEYRLRYIGIDSPEIGRQYFDEATAINRQLVGGMTVYLETDVSDTDRYGRLLRYVWLGVGGRWLFVNEELVRRGAAEAKEYPPDTAYHAVLEAAETEAESAGVGIWSSAFVPPLPFVGTPAPGGACDPAYPSVCIPPPPPDLDCGDVSFRRFAVLPPDPHHFDADGNGIGCESG